MFKLPSWILEIIVQFLCPKCSKKMMESGVMSVGIRKSYKNEKNEALYVEYRCKFCNEKTNIEMQNMSLEEFSMTVLEEIETAMQNEIMEKRDKSDKNPSEYDNDDEDEDDEDEDDYEDEDEIKKLEDATEETFKDIVKYSKTNSKNTNNPKKEVKSKISQKEIDDLIKKLNSIDEKELFKNLGILLSPENKRPMEDNNV